MVKKMFRIHGVKITGNTFMSQRTESVHLYSCPQAKLSPRFLSSLLQAEGNYPFPPNKVF